MRFVRTAGGALAIAATVTAIAIAAAAADESAAPVTVLVSRAAGGGAGGDGNSITPSISADGRYIAFASRAKNLGVKSGMLEIYLRDLSSKTTTLVSRANGATGAPADGRCYDPTISADGRYVAFASNAEDLSAEDGPNADVFVRDLAAGTTTLVSRATGVSGAAADGDGRNPAISADGRHVAFESMANNLSTEDRDENSTDVFVRDLDSGQTELISRASGATGAAGTDLSNNPSISADGRFVAFESRAPLTADDVDGEGFLMDIFVRDRAAATTTLVSRATGPTGAPSEVNSEDPAISADGRFVAFTSDAKLTGREDRFAPNVYLRDTFAATTTLVSVGDDQSGPPELAPSISAEGRYVAFQSGGNGITEVDAAHRVDVFVRDMTRGLTVDASRASGELGVPGDGPSFDPSISADGRYVAFDSRATNLGPDDPDTSDVFRRLLVYRKENPLPKCAGRTVTIFGTPGSDSITGTKRADVITALGGDDRVRSLTGGDIICAGAGRDRVDAGTNGAEGGFDHVFGGPGPDRLILGPELGSLNGGPGNDVLIGSKGGDELYGGAGNDVLKSGAASYDSDFLFGGPGNDVLFGGPGPDQMHGGPGRNRLVP
jgi:Tol biopolymer transport system component